MTMENKHKILVVDDEPINIEALNSLFEDEYDVFGATNGKQVLDLAKEIKPDIILLDIMMPDIDGISVCRNLKNNPEVKDIPVIFITGIADDGVEKKGFEAGCVDFIIKPIRPTITKLRIKNHIRLKVQTDILKDLSYLDGLTMIYNRRYFEETFVKEWQRCSRSKKPLALMMFDIDFFKNYNDTYGHIEGDECLKKIASCLKENTKRGGDFVARFGGEEFVYVLPETDLNGVSQIAEKILNSIRELAIPHKNSSVAEIVTISCGATAVIPDENKSPEVLIQNADFLLYRAKAVGKNQFFAKEMPMD